MHKLLLAVIAGLVTLCGVGNLPCFADSGAGVSIQLTTTVTGGSSGGSGGHSWGGGSYSLPPSNQSRQPSPYVPPVTNSYPPTMPTPPIYSNPPQVIPATGVPMPTEQGFNFGTILIGLGVAIALFAMWYLWNSKRKPKKIEIEQIR